MGGRRHAQAALPRGKTGTHCIGGWVGARAGLDGYGKSRPPPGFDSRTVQPAASRYTDYSIQALFVTVRTAKPLVFAYCTLADCTTQITLKQNIFIPIGSGISQQGVFILRSLNMRRRAFWQIDTKMHGVKPAKIVTLFFFAALGCTFNRTQNV